jgi:ATP-binding cassette, subfamily F, member 3
LLIDEPTNHLDADSREVLLQALLDYPGTLILVSHDRDFVAPLADQLIEVKNSECTRLVLTYEEYLQTKVQETQNRIQLRGGKDNKKEKPKREVSQTSGPSNNQIRTWERELQKLEAAIAKLERRQSEINERLSNESFEARSDELKKLIAEQTENQSQLDQSLTRWETVSSELDRYASTKPN